VNDPPAGGSSISTVAGFAGSAGFASAVAADPFAEAGLGFVGSVPGFAVPGPRSGRSPDWGSWVGVLTVVLQMVGTGPWARVPQVVRTGP
jgi:hypothetical protein